MTVTANKCAPNGEEGVEEEEDMEDAGDEQGEATVEKQKSVVSEGQRYKLKKGENWYLVDCKWYQQLERYLGITSCSSMGAPSAHPGPINNSNLFKDQLSQELKEHLMEGIDYMLLPEFVWKKLLKWYGLVEKQEELKRVVAELGLYSKGLKVEVYPTELKLMLNGEADKCVFRKFSKADTLGAVVDEMKEVFNLPNDAETRLWHKYMSNTYELLQNMDNTVQDAGLYHGQVLLLELKNEDGSWPKQTRSSSISSSSGLSSAVESTATRPVFSSGATTSGFGMYSSYGSSEYRTRRTSSSSSSFRGGLCGLSNLGNTCFMNSTLQCLSNTEPLTKYFLAGNHRGEINALNPLGMHGEIAKAYAELLNSIWSGDNSYVVPRNFKMNVGRFAPQFSGYQQQDSHELLAFLLDGLHEDLNRVKQKPYIEIPDAGGRADKVVAEEAWRNHIARNDSIIVDLFHGQFKSTVVCPECAKVSVTFDPFCYLSLPLPAKKERFIDVSFVPLDTTRKPVLLRVTVPKMGCIHDLLTAVGKETGISPDKLIASDVYGHRFHKIFEKRDPLSRVTDKDTILIFEIPVSSSELNLDACELLILPVYLREKRNSRRNEYTYSANTGLFGNPMLVPVPRRGLSYHDLYQLMLRAMRRFVRQPDRQEFEKLMSRLQTQTSEENLSGEDEEKIKDDSAEKEKEENNGNGMEIDDGSDTDISEIPYIFTVKSVNSSGSSDLEDIPNDGTTLKLTSKTYLALDWESQLLKEYYSEKQAEEAEEHPSMKRNASAKKTIELRECLDLFLTKEKLGTSDPWYCPTCKKHRQATKKFDLWTLPKILVIHLKRFSYNRYWRDKLDLQVDFPWWGLDLSSYVINEEHPPAVYDLHAISNHYGGMGGGHYTAFAKNFYDGKWYYFDDSSVTSADESQIRTKAAYVLFYTRRSDPSHEPTALGDILSDDEGAQNQSADLSSSDSEMES